MILSWTFLVLAPCFFGLVWAGIHALTSGVAGLAAIFFGGAATCAFALAIGVRSRISNHGMLEISEAGITSRVISGCGRLAWPGHTADRREHVALCARQRAERALPQARCLARPPRQVRRRDPGRDPDAPAGFGVVASRAVMTLRNPGSV
jgi:hypothetical protein